MLVTVLIAVSRCDLLVWLCENGNSWRVTYLSVTYFLNLGMLACMVPPVHHKVAMVKIAFGMQGCGCPGAISVLPEVGC